MKRQFKYSKLVVLIVLFLCVNASIIAQPPPPPPPPSVGHGAKGNQGPGKAPIGEGTFLLFGLAGLYSARKFYVFKKQLAED